MSKSRGARVTTGMDRVDDVLCGGLVPQSATLVRGAPGAGKTIFGLHFLADAVERGETGMYLNLGEPAAYLRETAEAFGLDIDPVEFVNRAPSGEQFHTEETYDLFTSAEVETPSLVADVREKIEQVDPDRVVVDPVTEFRYLTPDEHQFRTQVLGLLDFLKEIGATVILTSQAAESMPDDALQFLADAVITLSETGDRRTLQVSKFRGSSTQRGQHTLQISDEGMTVWPQLVPDQHGRDRDLGSLSSDVPALDALLGGGLTSGTITFFSGPTGVGKTTTGLQFLAAAAQRGQRAVFYSFEEDRKTLVSRAEAVGIPVREAIEQDRLHIEEVGPDELSIDELTWHVRTEVEQRDAEIVLLDGTSGFQRSLRGLGEDPASHLVKLGRYLRNMGATGLVTNEVHQITGEFRATEQGMSYLADNIVVLRHVEYKGELQKVIGVLKMRASDYETRIRRLQITSEGLTVGDPLPDLRGILTGTPEWETEDDG